MGDAESAFGALSTDSSGLVPFGTFYYGLVHLPVPRGSDTVNMLGLDLLEATDTNLRAMSTLKQYKGRAGTNGREGRPRAQCQQQSRRRLHTIGKTAKPSVVVTVGCQFR